MLFSRSCKFHLHFVATLIAIAASSAAETDKTINYLVVEDLSMPFQIAQDGQHLGGIISDVATEVFRNSDYHLEPRTFPIKRLHRFVREGDSGVWLGYDAKVWHSLSDMGDYIEPSLFPVKYSLTTCYIELTKVDNPNSIRGAQFAILDNFLYPELDRLSQNKLLTLIPVESYTRGFILTTAKRVTGFVEMDIRLKYNFNRLLQPSGCTKFVDFSAIIKAFDIYLILSKNAPEEIRQFITRQVTKLKSDGTINAILKRYATQVFLAHPL